MEKFGAPCMRVEGGDLGGPPIDIFVDHLIREPMIKEGVSSKSNSKGGKEGGDEKERVNVVSSSRASSRRGRKNLFPSRSHCMKTRSVAQGFGFSGSQNEVAIFIAKRDKDNGAWFKEKCDPLSVCFLVCWKLGFVLCFLVSAFGF